MQCDADKVKDKTDLLVDLRKVASDKGFTISDNPASGNCMFHALCAQLQSVKGIQISHSELRETVVQFLTDNPDMVSEWWAWIFLQDFIMYHIDVR